MLNQGRPLLRAERSGARSEKGAGWKRAHARGRWKFGEGSEKGFVRYGFIVLMEVVPVPGGVLLRRRVSAANTAGHWVERRTDSPGGAKNHERREFRIKCTLMQTVCLYNRHSINCNEYLLYLKVPVNYPLEYIYEN